MELMLTMYTGFITRFTVDFTPFAFRVRKFARNADDYTASKEWGDANDWKHYAERQLNFHFPRMIEEIAKQAVAQADYYKFLLFLENQDKYRTNFPKREEFDRMVSNAVMSKESEIWLHLYGLIEQA